MRDTGEAAVRTVQGSGVVLSSWFLLPLRGSAMLLPSSPGSLSLTRGYSLPLFPGRGGFGRNGPGGAEEIWPGVSEASPRAGTQKGTSPGEAKEPGNAAGLQVGLRA